MEFNTSWAFSDWTRFAYSLLVRHRVLATERHTAYYLRNKEAIKAKARAIYTTDRVRLDAKNRRTSARIKAECQSYILRYLRGHPCIDCGEYNPIVLEFDHRDRATKKRTVADMTAGWWGLSGVQAEIAKCDVRCANCHRIKTYHENGWTHRNPALA